ncbi:MAG: cytochrome C oxidase subunit IV family protein [Ginsengibacter sp.]
MSAQTSTHAIDDQSNKAHVKRIWKAFWILAILTAIELGLGLLIYFLEKGDPSYNLILFIKGVITFLTFLKAFYIISIFMHLGDEKRSMILSIGIPALLFIWFIIAFLADGASFRTLRNTNAHSRQYMDQSDLKHHVPGELVPPAGSPDLKKD